MAVKRVFLSHVPGNPRSDYLRAVLPLAEDCSEADAVAVPLLAEETAGALAAALAAGQPALLPYEALPKRLSRQAGESLSALVRSGLILCPLTELPGWAGRGASCPVLLTLARLKELAARGIERVFLANVPGATPLAVTEARRRYIHLTGGNYPGIGQSYRFGLVYAEK